MSSTFSRARGLGVVLGDLASLGYDAEWDSFPTGLNFGHRRERTFIVAYSMQPRLSQRGHSNTNGADGAPVFTRERFADVLASALPGVFGEDKPLLGRAIYGLPQRIHRIRSLGNAIVPQIAEIIGKAIMESENNFS